MKTDEYNRFMDNFKNKMNRLYNSSTESNISLSAEMIEAIQNSVSEVSPLDDELLDITLELNNQVENLTYETIKLKDEAANQSKLAEKASQKARLYFWGGIAWSAITAICGWLLGKFF